MAITCKVRRGPILATTLIALPASAPSLAQYAYLDDAHYAPSQTLMTPLLHDFPRVILSEAKALPSTAEGMSKYDIIRAGPHQLTSTLATAQRLNPDLLVMRGFNAAGIQGSDLKDSCSNKFSVPFGSTGPATENCAYFAGHWGYYAGTTLSQSISASSTSVTVANGSRITAGRYVVIYDAPAGSFGNAEHALVQSVSGNVVRFANRGFKSVARTHSAGSIIAEHTIAAAGEAATHWLYNMSTTCPRDSKGKQMADVMADWLTSNYQKNNSGSIVSGLRISGIVFDTDSWTMSWLTNLDVNNDLVGDAGWNSSTGTNYWGDGFDRFYQIVRDRLPSNLIIAGGDRWVRGFDDLNGLQIEGWPVSGSYDSANPSYQTIDEQLGNYVVHLTDAPSNRPAYTENLSKTPTRLYPKGLSARPSSNTAFRFALGTTLLDNGYYAQEPKSGSPDPWWDEFAVDVRRGSSTYGSAIRSNPSNESQVRANKGWLGRPLGARKRVYDTTAFSASQSLLSNSGLDTSVSGWSGSNVTVSLDRSLRLSGAGALRVSNHSRYSASVSGASVRTPSFSVRAGVDYTLTFAARAQDIRSIAVSAPGTTLQNFLIPADWTRRVMVFRPNTSGNISITFNVGRENIPIWLDEVYVFQGNANVFTREFENGLVVVNATNTSRTVPLGATYRRIRGTGQDTVNSGATVTSVTLGAYDAALLVKP